MGNYLLLFVGLGLGLILGAELSMVGLALLTGLIILAIWWLASRDRSGFFNINVILVPPMIHGVLCLLCSTWLVAIFVRRDSLAPMLNSFFHKFAILFR